jgi:hypothetical protein
MATTAADIITAAFIKVGVEAPTAAQNTSALISLNNMVSLLGADMLAPYVTTESLSVVSGDGEYTIGSGGQWNTVRPIGVRGCYLRNSDGYDFVLKIISTKDYARYSNKSYSARPSELVFLPEYPLAKIIFNTSPDADYTAYFEFWKNFTEFATSATAVTLPAEYKEALVYNLAVSLAEDWDRNVKQSVYAQAMRTKDVIQALNAAARTVPKVRFEFMRQGVNLNSDGYNIVSDEHIDGGAF